MGGWKGNVDKSVGQLDGQCMNSNSDRYLIALGAKMAVTIIKSRTEAMTKNKKGLVSKRRLIPKIIWEVSAVSATSKHGRQD